MIEPVSIPPLPGGEGCAGLARLWPSPSRSWVRGEMRAIAELSLLYPAAQLRMALKARVVSTRAVSTGRRSMLLAP